MIRYPANTQWEMEIQLSTKKLSRLENKKKKMKAYLEILRLNDQDQRSNLNTEADMSTTDEPNSKKLKTDIEFNENNNQSDDKMPKKKAATVSQAGETNVQCNTQSGKARLREEEYQKLKQEIRQRKKQIINMPRFQLTPVGVSAQISTPHAECTPLFLTDIQHLILFSILSTHSPYKPTRWCKSQKLHKVPHICILVVENISLRHYRQFKSFFPNLTTFDTQLEILTPSVYKGDFIDEFGAVPLTSTQKQKLVREFGSLEEALNCSKVFSMLKAVFPVEEPAKELKESYSALPKEDKFPRTHLLLSAWQLVEEDYPLPLKGSLRNKYMHYVLTKDVYKDVTANSPMFALDCEMCRTTTGRLELTRISVVNEKHELCYDTLVKPRNRIIDYLTKYSGITADMLKNVDTCLQDVQKALRELFPPDAILVGQSLNADLHSLQMMHPYIIDTSIIFNLTGDRIRKSKLQLLARRFLSEKIQQGNDGHCSFEDSISALKLVQLKLTRSIEFGDAVLSRNNKITSPSLARNYYGSSLLHHAAKLEKRVAIYSDEEGISKYKKYIQTGEESSKRIECHTSDTSKETLKTCSENLLQSDLSIMHVKLKEQDLEDTNAETTCHEVDKYVKKLLSKLPKNSMMIVLFGGTLGLTGVAFIELKTDVPVITST